MARIAPPSLPSLAAVREQAETLVDQVRATGGLLERAVELGDELEVWSEETTQGVLEEVLTTVVESLSKAEAGLLEQLSETTTSSNDSLEAGLGEAIESLASGGDALQNALGSLESLAEEWGELARGQVTEAMNQLVREVETAGRAEVQKLGDQLVDQVVEAIRDEILATLQLASLQTTLSGMLSSIYPQLVAIRVTASAIRAALSMIGG